MAITHPTVHLNGTSRQELTRQFQDQLEALDNAQRVLLANGPNARDYYVQGSSVYMRAVEDHVFRIDVLAKIKADLFELLKGVAE